MFIDFFYILKNKGINVTLSEWLTLQEALDKGLCDSSLSKFYYVSRMILVKSETEYDKFDLAFEEYFKHITSDDIVTDRMLRWLDKPEMSDLLQESEKQWLNKLEDLKIDKEDLCPGDAAVSVI